jgi:hypothetical protein
MPQISESPINLYIEPLGANGPLGTEFTWTRDGPGALASAFLDFFNSLTALIKNGATKPHTNINNVNIRRNYIYLVQGENIIGIVTDNLKGAP